MNTITFKGHGIHPEEHKAETQSKSSITISPAEYMYYPVTMHLGAPCKPLVKKGDSVLMGQMICDSDQFISCPVHSSVSGQVHSIEQRLTPHGRYADTIVIKNDFKDQKAQPLDTPGKFEGMTAESLAELTRKAGIVGMGGAAFPTHVKLKPPAPIQHLIINGSECEPYLTCDHRLMLEETDDIIYGAQAVAHCLNIPEIRIGVEQNKPDAIQALSQQSKKDSKIKVVPLRTRYPQGSEKQLINAITGKKVPDGKLPSAVGAIALNVSTCVAIAVAIKKGEPLTGRIVTVGGPAVNKPCNMRVRLGMPINEIFEVAGGFSVQPSKIIMGGPMMGIALPSLEYFILKGTSALLAFGQEHLNLMEESACIRCGACKYSCPAGLLPMQIDRARIIGDIQTAERLGVRNCIECGSCAYSCPAGRHIVQSVRLIKDRLNKQRKA